MSDQKYTFRSKDFYMLLESQKYRCPISGRELTPQSTCAEHIIPLRKGGKHELANICLVDEMVSKLKRAYSIEEIHSFAQDVCATLGKKHDKRISSMARNRKGSKHRKT